MARCTATNEAGQPCQAAALTDGEYCFMHDPASAGERAEARKRGGVNRRRAKSSDSETVTLEGPADLLLVLEQAINDVLMMENSHQRARTLGYLCEKALKALEVAELAERVEALEQMAGERAA